MKILQIHTKLVSGGIEAIVCNLANEMSKFHDVTVCTIFEPHEDDVFYARLCSRVKKISIGKKEFGFSLKEIFSIAKLIAKGGFDVVHMHGCFQYYCLAVLICHTKVKLFYTIHSDAWKENQVWDWRLFRFKSFCFRKKWIRPITISPESKVSFTELYRCESVMIKNGITVPTIDKNLNSLSKYRITPDTTLFIHPGRISEPKNQLVLCKVFDTLIKEAKDVVLLIAGYPEDKVIFKSLQPYFQERIVYLGERHDIPQLMSECDAFCLPSIWEGLPVTLLEAISVGCIPICSPVGGIQSVIKNGCNGIISLDCSKESYLSAIKIFLNQNNEERIRMQKNVYDSFSEYTIEKCAQNYIEYYCNSMS